MEPLLAGTPLLSFENLAALITLTALEIVLGIDNIVFLTIVAERVEPARRGLVRRMGLLLAMGLRILLLLGLAWILHLTRPLFGIAGRTFNARDLVLLAGGLFLIAKGTFEIHHHVAAGASPRERGSARPPAPGAALAQIAAMDLIFSLDSVITALGMARHVAVMVAAVVLAVLVMLAFADLIGRFVETHLPIKTLALAFLVMVGVLLVADGLHHHLPRGYVYFAMAFSLAVELLNLRAQARRERAARPETRP